MSDSTNLMKKYVRATNYITAVQIYLQNNVLLKDPLNSENIKSRLLGHWGTSPGINFVYAQLNNHIIKHKTNMMFVLGPGHGFPALQANLFVEGTLEKYYPKATSDEMGLAYIAKNFSWPYGFPSHSNPGTPGVILEGGELGYSLSTSFGAVLDNPDLVVACLVGDGEAETGPTATAWHLNKLVDPVTNGVVLPIIHLNGYKISGPTLYGRMSNKDLKSLFNGYGYEPYIVEGKDNVVYEKMEETLEKCFATIKEIKNGKDANTSPRLPMIILRTPKGWTGIKKLHGEKIEDNCLSHQVVANLAKTDKGELKEVSKWLQSYSFTELFDGESGFIDDIKKLIPPVGYRMGDNDHAFGGERALKQIVTTNIVPFTESAIVPGTVGSSSMTRLGLYMTEIFKLNEHNKNFRLFSPDETYSNKLQQVFTATKRAFLLPSKSWDKDYARDGRVIEMLSEHSLQGLFEGYILTGRHAVFASYEAFVPVITSMADQYAKFLKASQEVSWRGDISSLNYILTSSGWRQEHNGFSHQNPGFITDMLQKSGCFVHVYFPPDGNSTLAVFKHCLESKNSINIIVAGKTVEPRWLTPELAEKELMAGLMTWGFASEENPDIVFASVGDYLTKESLAGIEILKEEAPEVRVRFVNIMELSTLGIGNEACRVPLDFESYFTEDKPVIFNFHGYPQTLKQVLFDYGNNQRFSIHGYIENGSTTTPFDMHVRNHTSRYHLVIEAFETMAKNGIIEKDKAKILVKKYQDKLESHREYIINHGVDPDEIENWQWKNIISQ